MKPAPEIAQCPRRSVEPSIEICHHGPEGDEGGLSDYRWIVPGQSRPGGWACILRFGAVKKELFGYDPHTTNNRMELMAAIQGLLAFKEPCEIEITTDAE